MNVIAIDPGTTQSAVVELSGSEIVHHEILDNDILTNNLATADKVCAILVVEMIASYGMPVGKDVFETCVWIGRFIQAWNSNWDGYYERMYRKEVKMHLCGNPRAKDSNIRQAIIDLYPPIGGGKTPQIGTKKQPGPLYGIKSDEWAALAVALTHQANVDGRSTS